MVVGGAALITMQNEGGLITLCLVIGILFLLLSFFSTFFINKLYIYILYYITKKINNVSTDIYFTILK